VNDQIRLAYNAVSEAVRLGVLNSPADSKCERCGKPRPDKHHEDYSKPLEVTYLCRSCHKICHHEKKHMNKKIIIKYRLLKVRATLWHRMKILAVKNNVSLQDLTEHALTQWLKYSPSIAKGNDDGR
jgi:hypothetical protein